MKQTGKNMAPKLKQLAKDSYFNKCNVQQESDDFGIDETSYKDRSLSIEELQKQLWVWTFDQLLSLTQN